jgi:hypothetical protein
MQQVIIIFYETKREIYPIFRGFFIFNLRVLFFSPLARVKTFRVHAFALVLGRSRARLNQSRGVWAPWSRSLHAMFVHQFRWCSRMCGMSLRNGAKRTQANWSDSAACCHRTHVADWPPMLVAVKVPRSCWRVFGCRAPDRSRMRSRSPPHHAGFFRVSSQKNDVAPPWLCGAGCSRLRRRRLCSLPVQPPWCFVATSAASAFSPAQMEKAVANTGGQAL